MSEAYAKDSILPKKLWLDDYTDKLFGAFYVTEDNRIYQNESEATSKVGVRLLDSTKGLLAAKRDIENCVYC